jgi:hypothetical protein
VGDIFSQWEEVSEAGLMCEPVDIEHGPTFRESRMPPSTLDEYEVLLERHPYVADHPRFKEKDRFARAYLAMRNRKETDSTIPLSKLSHDYEIEASTVWYWFSSNPVKRRLPRLFQELASHERLRILHEARIPSEARRHRVDPSDAYEILKPLKAIDNFTPIGAADRLSKLCKMILKNENLIFVELRPYNTRKGPRWLLEVGESIEHNLPETEEHLNKQLSNDSMKYRLGCANKTLYIWKRQTDPFGYLTLFDGECFYFNQSDRRTLIREARNHLNLKGNIHLTTLLQQITDVSEAGRASISAIGADVRHDRDHLFGETLQFILDITGRDLTDIAPKIRAIGQQEQIKNPRILEGGKLLELMARLYAIVASDGHVGELWNFLGYHEYNPARIRIVKDLVQKLGDVRSSYFHDAKKIGGLRVPIPRRLGRLMLRFGLKGNISGLRFPHVLGRLMIKLGMPAGDKSIQEVGLPDFILYGSPEVVCAYLEEVIPEDGKVVLTEKTRSIGITRNTILYDATKSERYGFEQRLSQEHIELIKQQGAPRGKTSIVQSRALTIGTLRKLGLSENPELSIPAREILRVALQNPSTLLQDEYELLKALGIKCPEPLFQNVQWFEKSKRVSATWALSVGDQISIAMWGLLALPNDKHKAGKLNRWMTDNPEIVERAYDKLRTDGLHP